MQSTVCAHELGHDQLHRVFASDNYFREFALYDMTLRPEYEANVFAAELLLPDEDIIDLITLGYDNAQIAQALNSDTNLVGIKVSALSNRGYNYRIPDFRSDFLKGG
jgi:Zn-dependent peptidase ImmA (M78 family)